MSNPTDFAFSEKPMSLEEFSALIYEETFAKPFWQAVLRDLLFEFDTLTPRPE